MNENRGNDQTRKRIFIISLVSALAVIIGFVYIIVAKPLGEMSANGVSKISDHQTLEILPEVNVLGDMFTIEWLSDSMDRGNHDLDTSVHGNLVVSTNVEAHERGNIIYYQHDDDKHIGRIVGLPGETVEIKEGQVYIDGKLLQTFYGVATSGGLTKDEYFARVTAENVNIKEMEKYFQTSMDAIEVQEDTLFVLVDMWWRGKDSQELGLIPLDQVEGQIIGYEK